MKNDPKIRDEFLKEIGRFIVRFARLESGLTNLSAFTVDDIRYYEVQVQEKFGLSLHAKRDIIKKFINQELPFLSNEWESINAEIGKLNHFRRHLIHGTGDSYLFHPTMTTMIKNNSKLETMTFTVKEIRKLISRIDELSSGENGILGVFGTKFKLAAINWYNDTADVDKRVRYIVNGEVITEWKG